jgi:formylglycine-generating enzyme required for sulfatase activity
MSTTSSTQAPPPRSASKRPRRFAPVPASTSRSSAWEPPSEFDDYTLVRLLGRGGMGAVYLAEDVVLARNVAVKFVAVRNPDPATRQRFLVEARAAARIQHPNVVSIHRVGEIDQHPYLVTEFARGKTLDKLGEVASSRRAIELGLDIARGLAAAHRCGVLHCDLKPQNVIVTDAGAKLLDFGLATLMSRVDDPVPDAARTLSSRVVKMSSIGGPVIGTPDYMAPEIWLGEPPTQQSDLYAVGVVLFELVAGRPPFASVPVDRLGLVIQRLPAEPLADVVPDVDRELASIVDRCLAIDPRTRFSSADELREALEELVRGGAARRIPEGNPYRGLRAFESEQRALFFGRAAEIGLVLERLRVDSFVIVTGESGVGKSSICRAGLLPEVLDGALAGGRTFRVATMTPGKRPLHAFAAAIAPTLGLAPSAIIAGLLEDPAWAASALARKLGGRGGLFLFVDQAEEILTVSDPEEGRAVDAALASLTRGVPSVKVLATLRADFLARFAGLERLGADVARYLYFLRPLSPERTREVICGPARATGLRFESEALVDTLVASTGQGGLPLLQFALAELWERRDEAARVIRASALEQMGGVGGALARHADTVIIGMPRDQRTHARRMLMRLVTLDSTRVRRTQAELCAEQNPARAALDALVRARLLVAYDADEGSAFEIAHEVLITTWRTLGGWLAEESESRATRERLSIAAVEWRRLHNGRELLWTSRQLAELARVHELELTPAELSFVEASKKQARSQRLLRRAAIISAPLLCLLAYSALRYDASRDVRRRVREHLVHAADARAHAAVENATAEIDRAGALFLFDASRTDEAEVLWSDGLTHARAGAAAQAREGRELEAAFAQDPERADVRAALGRVLLERALVAERDDSEQRDDLAQRFALYDTQGALARLWNAPGRAEVACRAPGAVARLLEYRPERQAYVARGQIGVPTTLTLPRGSYLLEIDAPDREPLRAPFVVQRAELTAIDATPTTRANVPEGFVYIPPGDVQFGASGDESTRRGFFSTVPQHPRPVAPFIIGRAEVTYADWIQFLRERADGDAGLAPDAADRAGGGGSVSLRLESGLYVLQLQLGTRSFTAKEGERLRYEGRHEHVEVPWESLPVTGISALDAKAYMRWLASTGRVRGARLCTEIEWERAARGADGRPFPWGWEVMPGAMNIDESHTRALLGPDPVGTHPVGASPFGVEDMSGNAYEWTTSVFFEGGFVARGGSYFHDRKTAEIANRTESSAQLHDATLGLRACASRDAPE